MYILPTKYREAERETTWYMRAVRIIGVSMRSIPMRPVFCFLFNVYIHFALLITVEKNDKNLFLAVPAIEVRFVCVSTIVDSVLYFQASHLISIFFSPVTHNI